MLVIDSMFYEHLVNRRPLMHGGPLLIRCLHVLQDGVVLVWRSSDPMLQAHEASGALAGRTVVGISAGDLGVCFGQHLHPLNTAAVSDAVATTGH